MLDKLRVLFVASEAVPHAKTGGLADVVGALPRYLNRSGVETTTLMPKYKGIEVPTREKITVRMNGPRQVGVGRDNGFLFIDYPEFFARDGLYGDGNGDYKDNCERFGLFCMAALQIVQKEGYDIVHCHDWQSGLLPLYMKRSRVPAKSVFTIHNLGYQGRFSKDKLSVLGLGESYFTPEGVEFYGDISFLKTGIVYADIVTTVSENYALEIQTPELGFGLDGVLRSRAHDLHGIVNGIDYEQWNPEKDGLIYQQYSDYSGKQVNKAGLCTDNCLDTKRPLIGMVSRIAGQKGFDILVCAIDEIVKLGFNMVILGLGEESYHEKLLKLANIYHGRLSVNIKFDNRLAHRIYAGSDFFLMPSLYEPCGLGQLISLRYGTVPIVRKTGGLADTVSEFDTKTIKGNGFLFNEYKGQAIVDALGRASRVYSDPETFKRLSEGCMHYNYSWAESARKYHDLYSALNSP
jgi:starch synthase